MEPIPVYVLTGCLGAGKTTTLNGLLDTPWLSQCSVALIINEFGSEGIDGDLVRPGAYRRFDLNRGSLFCICIKTDFLKTLQAIAEEPPDLVLVEATGVAEPTDLEAFIDEPHLAGRFRVAATVCVVDALNFVRVAAFMRSAQSQVRQADGIAIAKTDLIAAEEADALAGVLRGINPDAPQVRAEKGRLPDGFVESLRHHPGDLRRITEPPRDLAAVSLRLATGVTREALDDALLGLGPQLLRAKGLVDFGDGPVLLESVFGRLGESPAPPSAALGKLTVIVQGIAAETVRRRLSAVAAPASGR